VPAGQATVVSGGGFPAGSALQINLFSTPVLLATTTADRLGNFQATVTIPAATVPGVHTIVVAAASGSPSAQTSITVTVAAAAGTTTSTTVAALSFTGANSRGPGLVGLGLTLAGAAMVIVTWRRRRFSGDPFPSRPGQWKRTAWTWATGFWPPR
jgi:hypothetical protein